MDSVFIVLPILSLLMFDLGLGLHKHDFFYVAKRPRAVLAGIFGQIVMLPGIVYLLAQMFDLQGAMYVGLMLIACCPGGSSSNVFTGIAHGDVALSVSLTALTSVITLITLPLIMGSVVELPVMSLVIQNLVLVLLPVIFGMMLRHFRPRLARGLHKVLGKLAFPLLMLLAVMFFVGNRELIMANFAKLGVIVTMLIMLAIAGGAFLGWLGHLRERERRTLIIEIGMQNAAQAIALSTSPLVFNNAEYAIPAIVYALMMNVILLIYVGIVSQWKC